MSVPNQEVIRVLREYADRAPSYRAPSYRAPVLSDDEIAEEMRLEQIAEDRASHRRGDYEGLAQTWRRSA